jgi:hypothetical protein
LSAAIAFHALHNYAIQLRLPGLILSGLVLACGTLSIIAIAVLAWRHENRWIEQELAEEITLGTISVAEYMAAVSAKQRAKSEITALVDGGLQRFRQVARLHHELTELAFHKYHQRRADRHLPRAEIVERRERIIALREKLSVTDG